MDMSSPHFRLLEEAMILEVTLQNQRSPRRAGSGTRGARFLKFGIFKIFPIDWVEGTPYSCCPQGED